jgi:hypothetical protein
MKNVAKALGLLGSRQRDLVTGLTGVITSVSFDINGCIQVAIKPPAENGKMMDGCWIDVDRIEENGTRAFPAFPFLERERERVPGPAEKPAK